MQFNNNFSNSKLFTWSDNKLEKISEINSYLDDEEENSSSSSSKKLRPLEDFFS